MILSASKVINIYFRENELLKNFEKLTSGINKDKLEEVEVNVIKKIGKQKKHLNHKERKR
jgi:hypothetical protein